MKTTEQQIIVINNYNASIKKVWFAITNITKMRQWFFNNIDAFKAEVGTKSNFLVKSDIRKFTHLWEIKKVIPFQKISYYWRYKEYKGNSITTFDLKEIKNNTELTLTVTVLEDFPNEIPEFNRESCINGWNYFLGENLKTYLEK